MTQSVISGPGIPTPPPADVVCPSFDGTLLRGRFWAHPAPRGILVLSHGLGEHGGSYRRTAEALVAILDLDIVAFDYRGFGRSPGKRGVIRSYDDLTFDLEAANRWAAAGRPDLPRFLLGHSNGGLVAIRTVLERDLGLAGLILSNPSIRVTAHAPAWKIFMAEILVRVAPRITLETGLESEQLSSDPAVIAEIDADPLRHSWICPPMYFGMIGAGRIAREKAAEISVPALVLIGGADPIADPEVGRVFFETLGSPDKTLKSYPEMRHEPLSEVGRSAVIADVANWLGPRLKASGDQA